MIKVGAKFNKVGTEEVVTVVKYDEAKGTVIIKFPSGKSIPMSTGSLMKTEKWVPVDSDDVKEEIKEEKPKKEKKQKPLAKERKKKIQTRVYDLLVNYLVACDRWEELNEQKDKTHFEWSFVAEDFSVPMVIKYLIKEKQFEIFFNDDIAKLLDNTEFDGLGEIKAEYIEDKLKALLDTIVTRLNEKTESEEN